MEHKPDLEAMEDLVVANTIQFDTMYRILIDKGYFTETEFDEKLNEVQDEYQGRSKPKQ